MKIKPLPYQVEGVQRINDFHGVALLADEMGLGKTFQALMYIKQHRNLGPALVVCPASVKTNWSREALKLVGMSSCVISGRNRSRELRAAIKMAPIVIVNYDILANWVPFLAKLKWSTIVMDECQYIKNTSTTRTKSVLTLAKNINARIALSGTPLTNKPIDLYSVLKILRPDLCSNKMAFAVKFCRPKRERWGWTYNGARNLPKLHTLLKKHVMIRRTKSEVANELPPKQRHMVVLDIPPRHPYFEAKENFIEWLTKVSPNKAKRAQRAVAINRMTALRQLATEAKVESFIEWLSNSIESTDDKFIVLGVHQEPLNAIHKHFKKCSVLVNGSVTGTKRQAAVDALQHNRNIRILTGNIVAAGVGLNLTAASHVVIFEPPWTPDLVRQGEDRAHRIGQTKNVNVWFPVAAGTIEETLLSILTTKQKIIDSILDGKHTHTEFDVFDELLNLMVKS